MVVTSAFTADWSAVSEGWNRNRDHVEQMKQPLTQQLLAGLALQPGEQVLELGAGTGDLSRHLAELVGPAGRVLATDVAAGMVELIAKTTADLPWVEAAQVDASSIGQPDGTFAAVVFRMGLMFLPEPSQGLAEMHRVLAPGGRLAAATWAGPQHNPWLTTAGMALVMQGLLAGGGPTAPGAPMSLGEPEQLDALAKEAGFESVAVREVDLVARFPDVDAYLAHVGEMAPPFKAALQVATEAEQAAVREAVASGVGRFTTADGLALPARALLLQATR